MIEQTSSGFENAIEAFQEAPRRFLTIISQIARLYAKDKRRDDLPKFKPYL